jgi:hypothetical protein
VPEGQGDRLLFIQQLFSPQPERAKTRVQSSRRERRRFFIRRPPKQNLCLQDAAREEKTRELFEKRKTVCGGIGGSI